MVRQRVVWLVLVVAGMLLVGNAAGVTAQDGGVFFSSTGHSLDDSHGFLSYWQQHNGAVVLGAPVTEPLREGDLLVQYFAYGRLEWHADQAGGTVVAGRVGAEYAEALWMSFEAPARQAIGPDEPFFDATGYAVREPFVDFWNAGGGVATFGYPISDRLWEYVGNQMVLVQYFERARLERHGSGTGGPDDVRVGNLGLLLAMLRGYDTTPVDAAQVGGVVVDEHGLVRTLPTPTPSPTPTLAPTSTPAVPTAAAARDTPAPQAGSTGQGKSIVVNLSQQWLYAYAGGSLVFDAPVSTGRDGFNTPAGSFRVYAKVRSQTMSGTLGGEYYNVPNVPHVMYIHGGVALHGTYWHNQFGTGVRMSHGCINLPLSAAAWLYDWAPMGTLVTVTY
jgi:lipoprotein-anchoring transpeptidase ErfK/SrfK